MLAEKDTYVTIEDFRVRTSDKRETNTNRIIELVLSLPLTQDIAAGIDPAMARDLFELTDAPGAATAGDWKAKPEIGKIQFNLRTGVYVMSARSHTEQPVVLSIQAVTLRSIVVKMTDSGVLLLSFKVMWTMAEEEKEMGFVARHLKNGVYLTLANSQPALDLDSSAPSEGADVKVDSHGVVESIASRRGRARKPKAAEETVAQE